MSNTSEIKGTATNEVKHSLEIPFTITQIFCVPRNEYRIGCVSTRFGLLHALAYYAQHNCDFIMTINMRFGLLRAFGL